MKDKFNKYCAKVMGYTIRAYGKGELVEKPDGHLVIDHNPYDDLNQMAEVIEKLLDDANIYIENQKYPNKYMITRDGFKQAFRNFIISTEELQARLEQSLHEERDVEAREYEHEFNLIRGEGE